MKNEFGAQLVWPGRPRTYKAPRWGRQGRMYSAHTEEMKSIAFLITRKPCKDQTETQNISRPVSVGIQLFFRRPKTYVGIVNVWPKIHYRTSGELHSSPRAPSFCCKRPDIDNYRLECYSKVCVSSSFWMYSNAQRYWTMTSSCAD